MRMNRVRLVQRSKEWFDKKHPYVRVDRGNDPFPAERALQKAGEEGKLAEGKKRAKKIRAGEEGSKARGECDLNRLYDLEKEGRKGRCTYYQVHNKEPASACKTSWFCKKCKVFLHSECLYDYHRARYGIILDLEYEINKVRRSRKMLKKLPRGVHKMNHVRQSPDIHSDCSVESTGSQRDRPDIPRLNDIWETRYLMGPDTGDETVEPNNSNEEEDSDASTA